MYTRLNFLLGFLLSSLVAFTQVDDSNAANELVSYCQEHFKQKVGRGQCTDLIFYALSDMEKNLGQDTRKIYRQKEELKPGDIVHMEWKKNLRYRQHYMIVLEVLDGAKVKVAHQNFNNQLKVVYTNYDLNYEAQEKNRKVSVYRLVHQDLN